MLFDLELYSVIAVCIFNFVCLIMLFFEERSSPARIASWALLFIILPVLGFLFYLFMGQTYYSAHKYKLKGISEEDVIEAHALDLENIEHEPNEDYRKAAKALYNFGAISYTSNNVTKLYTLGEDKFRDLYTDIRNAKKSVNLEYYIIRDDELGNELMDLLIQKVNEGVEVRLLTDDVGIGKGPAKAIKRFTEAGGQFAVFHKVAYLILSPKKNNRNHRKIAVIDGEIGYCGGFNIGDEYLGKGPLGFWRDSAVRIQGCAVYGLQIRFWADWAYVNKIPFEYNPDYYPDSCMAVDGSDRISVVYGGPDISSFNPIRMQYLQMISNAKSTAYIHSPYFILDDSLTDALSLAAARGVDVRVIIPDKPDHPFVYWNNIRCSYMVMQNGVRVFKYNRGFVHSKTMVVDGEYCSVGSANFDDRSLVLNFETNAAIFSKSIGSQMDEAFMDDLKYSTEYSIELYDEEFKHHKFKIAFSRLFGGLA